MICICRFGYRPERFLQPLKDSPSVAGATEHPLDLIREAAHLDRCATVLSMSVTRTAGLPVAGGSHGPLGGHGEGPTGAPVLDQKKRRSAGRSGLRTAFFSGEGPVKGTYLQVVNSARSRRLAVLGSELPALPADKPPATCEPQIYRCSWEENIPTSIRREHCAIIRHPTYPHE